MKSIRDIKLLLSIKQWVKMTLIFVFLLLISSLFNLQSIPLAHAATNAPAQIFNISPAIINVPLSPGKKYTYKISVTNLSDKPLPLAANLNDFQTTGEEGDYIFADTHINPLLSWITLSDNTLLLSPHEKKTVNLIINTPKNIPLGGYYGILFFEPVLQSMDPTQTRVISRVGILLLADIGVPDPNAKQADILTFTTGLFHEDNTIPLLLRVKNVSLHFFTAKPILTISPLISLTPQDVQPLYLEDKIIFQDKVRRWEQTITLPSNHPNIYKVHLAVSTGNGNYVMKDQYLVVFPFTKALMTLIIIVVVVFLLRKRKRLRVALTILFNKQ